MIVKVPILGNISEDEYKKRSAELQRTIATLSKEPEKKEIRFTTNWKSLYEELDEEHRRAFWRGLIKEVKISEDGKPTKIIY